MDALKKIGTWIFALGFLAFIIYRNLDGWFINPPKPEVVMMDGKMWVLEPDNNFMHYMFGSSRLREARENPATGQIEYEKGGQWYKVPE